MLSSYNGSKHMLKITGPVWHVSLMEGLPGECRTAAAERIVQASNNCPRSFPRFLRVSAHRRGPSYPSRLSPPHSASAPLVSSAEAPWSFKSGYVLMV